MSDQDELLRVLDAREARWNQRLQLSAEQGRALVTITFCLPLACRTHTDYTALFPRLCGHVLRRLNFAGITAGAPIFLEGADGPACLLPVSGTAFSVKHLCVKIEEQLCGGRMLDIDVMDSKGAPVGRSQLKLPPRRCLVCKEPAAVCVAGRVHPPEQILTQARLLRQQALSGL